MIIYSIIRKKTGMLLVLSVIICVSVLIKPSLVQSEQGIFSTWEGFEADKCASIWLIKRFIDKSAVIKFYPRGEEIQEGIPFDTPDAKFRRYHNMSTFESMLKHYNLQDSKLSYIGKIIHDIEINIWERKVMQETLAVKETISDIMQQPKSNEEIIEKSLQYFDSFYLNLTKKDNN